MKRLFLLVACCIALLVSANAQFRKIPADATNALKAKYPNAEKVEWKDKVTFFQAQFEDNGVPYTADFSNKGEWQQSEIGLNWDGTPKEVKEGFKKSKYSDPNEWKIGDRITKIVKSDNSTKYRVYVDEKGGLQKKYLYFNPDGQLEKESVTL
jgi:hypothetical protein